MCGNKLGFKARFGDFYFELKAFSKRYIRLRTCLKPLLSFLDIFKHWIKFQTVYLTFQHFRTGSGAGGKIILLIIMPLRGPSEKMTLFLSLKLRFSDRAECGNKLGLKPRFGDFYFELKVFSKRYVRLKICLKPLLHFLDIFSARSNF